jgi:protein-L-isoaspartate(D-aspartate) O-methyltransferase|tara:strand:+ start:45050 stop:45679 length:630 start_codon:yes stop_codon:yes gene_type:complete
MNKEELLKHLEKNSRVLKSKKLRDAFATVDRKDFVRPDYSSEAYEDYPIPIEHGQTISQPTTVAFMLELLDPKEGEHILDVGSGSGWTTALLAKLVGKDGKVIGAELVPELVKFGQDNLSRYNFSHAQIIEAGKKLGHPSEAPFDKILVSAASNKLPQELVDQLTVGGRMVIPITDSICVIDKTQEDATSQKTYTGFAFVPLITENHEQ